MERPRVAWITPLKTSCIGQEEPQNFLYRPGGTIPHNKRNISARYWGHPPQSPPREKSLVSTAVIQVCPRHSGATLVIGDNRPLSTLVCTELTTMAAPRWTRNIHLSSSGSRLLQSSVTSKVSPLSHTPIVLRDGRNFVSRPGPFWARHGSNLAPLGVECILAQRPCSPRSDQ